VVIVAVVAFLLKVEVVVLVGGLLRRIEFGSLWKCLVDGKSRWMLVCKEGSSNVMVCVFEVVFPAGGGGRFIVFESCS
jgi:hypothetical protein